jgi:hypothetical protein
MPEFTAVERDPIQSIVANFSINMLAAIIANVAIKHEAVPATQYSIGPNLLPFLPRKEGAFDSRVECLTYLNVLL